MIIQEDFLNTMTCGISVKALAASDSFHKILLDIVPFLECDQALLIDNHLGSISCVVELHLNGKLKVRKIACAPSLACGTRSNGQDFTWHGSCGILDVRVKTPLGGIMA